MSKGVACYFGQLEPLIGTREIIDAITLPKIVQGIPLATSDPCLRFTRTGLLEVYRPIEVTVVRPWLKKPEIEWQAQQGNGLRPIRRRASRYEIALIEANSGVTETWRARRQNGIWTVAIVEKFESEDAIFALIRQLECHIWASLVGREQEGLVITYGDKQIMEQAIRALALITLWLTEEVPTLQMDIAGARQKVRKMAFDLEGVKAKAKVTALELLTRIAEENNQENLLELIAEAQRLLASRRKEDVKMALACAKRARRILEETVRKIDQGIRDAFNKLASLRRQLELPAERGLTFRQLEKTAQQVFNTFAFLVRVGTFDPYQRVVHTKEVANLRDAKTRAVAFGARGLRNDQKRALAKLEILIKGLRA